MQKLIETVLNYLKQPSTYTGLATLLAVFGITMTTDLIQAVSAVIIAVIGLYEVIRKEHLNEK